MLFLTYQTTQAGGGLTDVWRAVEAPLKLAQTAAVMEVVHSALGLVRSPVAITGAALRGARAGRRSGRCCSCALAVPPIASRISLRRRCSHPAAARPPARFCPPAATQVASRLFILWGVVDLVPATRASPLVLLRLPRGGGGAALQLSLVTLLTAWCCSEVIRYSFFAFKASPASA